MLIVRYIDIIAEVDDFEQGYVKNSAINKGYSVHLTASDQSGIIDALKELTETTAYEINPCGDEPNRIEFQRLENEYGFKATADEVKQWKVGLKKLWHATFTAYIEQITDFELVE